MIEIKPPEEETLKINFTEEHKQAFDDFVTIQNQARIVEKVAIDENITKEFHELNKTLKEILREMRKRKV
jgi:hypothetical protein